jgi:hypothetical protein
MDTERDRHDNRTMRQTFTHKGFTFELKENQGFFVCLVYEIGGENVLYQTKYFGSADRAKSKAMKFIHDFIAHEEAKKQKAIEKAEKKQKRRSKKKDKGKKATAKPPVPKPKDVRESLHSPEPNRIRPTAVPETPKRQAVTAPAPSPKPITVATDKQETKGQDVVNGRREGFVNTIIAFSALILIITGIVYGYAELGGQNDEQGLSVGDSTVTIEPVIGPPSKQLRKRSRLRLPRRRLLRLPVQVMPVNLHLNQRILKARARPQRLRLQPPQVQQPR